MAAKIVIGNNDLVLSPNSIEFTSLNPNISSANSLTLSTTGVNDIIINPIGANIHVPTLAANKVVLTDSSNNLITGDVDLSTQTTGSIDLTTQVTGILPIANGGTNNNIIGGIGQVAYSDGTKIVYTTGGTTGQLLQKNNLAAPTWVNAPSGGVSSVSGGTGINITGPITDPVVNLTTPVSIANGGTNTTTIGASGTVAYSNGTSYNFTAQGSAGQFLMSQGSGAPIWSTPSATTNIQKIFQSNSAPNAITNPGAGVAVSIFDTGSGSLTIPIGTIVDGSQFNIRAYGNIAAAAATTITTTVTINGVSPITASAVTTGGSYYIDCAISKTNTSATSGFVSSMTYIGTTILLAGNGVITLDPSIPNTINFTFTFSTTSLANSITKWNEFVWGGY